MVEYSPSICKAQASMLSTEKNKGLGEMCGTCLEPQPAPIKLRQGEAHMIYIVSSSRAYIKSRALTPNNRKKTLDPPPVSVGVR